MVSLFFVGTQPAIAGGFDRAIESVMPRVVKLYGLGAGLQAGYGTGMLVSPDGYILTVYSLLLDSQHLRVVLQNGALREADVVYRDEKRQLALLKLQPVGASVVTDNIGSGTTGDGESSPSLDALPFFDLSCQQKPSPASVSMLRPGDWVVAAGNPFHVADGAEPMSLAHGVFSTRVKLDARRRLRDFPYTGEVLVIDAITSNPGAPGSALVNLDGTLLGMVGRLVMSNRTHTHLNYAIPLDVLCDFYQTGLSAERGEIVVDRGRDTIVSAVDLGMKLARTGYKKVLPFVERVKSDSPASKAGVRKDDLLLSVNGYDVVDVKAVDARLASLSPGEPLELVIRRGRRILTVTVLWTR